MRRSSTLMTGFSLACFTTLAHRFPRGIGATSPWTKLFWRQTMHYLLTLIHWCYNQPNYCMNCINANYNGEGQSCVNDIRLGAYREIPVLFSIISTDYLHTLGQITWTVCHTFGLVNLFTIFFVPRVAAMLKMQRAMLNQFTGSTWKTVI